jgi:outer membrane protein OmpA-like peptidoglycan-associated protein
MLVLLIHKLQIKMNEKDIEAQIKEAELNKLLAEEQKINSEKLKLDYERKQLEEPFYKRFQFIQILIAGVLGGLAFLGVLQSIIEPLYKRDIIREELKVAKQEKYVSALEDSISIKKDSISRNRLLISFLEEKIAYSLDSIKIIKNENEKLLSEIIVQEQLNEFIENTKTDGLLIGTIYFEYDKISLQNEFVDYIKRLSQFLIDNPQINILVYGYSSEIGTEAYNMKLSERRAQVVIQELLKNGVSPDRLGSNNYGESKFEEDIMKNLDADLRKKLYELKSIAKIIISN